MGVALSSPGVNTAEQIAVGNRTPLSTLGSGVISYGATTGGGDLAAAEYAGLFAAASGVYSVSVTGPDSSYPPSGVFCDFGEGGPLGRMGAFSGNGEGAVGSAELSLENDGTVWLAAGLYNETVPAPAEVSLGYAYSAGVPTDLNIQLGGAGGSAGNVSLPYEAAELQTQAGSVPAVELRGFAPASGGAALVLAVGTGLDGAGGGGGSTASALWWVDTLSGVVVTVLTNSDESDSGYLSLAVGSGEAAGRLLLGYGRSGPPLAASTVCAVYFLSQVAYEGPVEEGQGPKPPPGGSSPKRPPSGLLGALAHAQLSAARRAAARKAAAGSTKNPAARGGQWRLPREGGAPSSAERR